MPTKRTKRTAVNDDYDYDGGEAVALLLKAIGEFMDCINCDKQFTVVSVVVPLLQGCAERLVEHESES